MLMQPIIKMITKMTLITMLTMMTVMTMVVLMRMMWTMPVIVGRWGAGSKIRLAQVDFNHHKS